MVQKNPSGLGFIEIRNLQLMSVDQIKISDIYIDFV